MSSMLACTLKMLSQNSKKNKYILLVTFKKANILLQLKFKIYRKEIIFQKIIFT